MKQVAIRSAAPLSDEALLSLQKRFTAMLGEEAALSVTLDASLIGGFVAQADGKIYDMSVLNKLGAVEERFKKQPMAADEKDLKAFFGTQLGQLLTAPENESTVYDYGTVTNCADGVVHVEGLSRSLYGELIEFEGGAFGMALELSQDGIGVVLFTGEEEVAVGGIVRGTRKVLSVGVGEKLLGRTVDPLSRPLDGKPLELNQTRPIESPAPGIMDRAPVSAPLQTGILAIDSMIPIGKGQRELIIGDRQIGKTTIGLSAMLNQASKGVISIYCAIGQKAGTVALLRETLQQKGAMDNAVIVAATASDSAAMQYIAPYAACAMAEYFMHNGRDVLVIYDDLSKHAQSYRTMSLLLKRPPGREAYPGDVFYLHSRLLERAAKLSDALGGGSMTALPLIETMAGDISAYIPTNVISITDGQIYLESELFHSGVRPAVNVGLSVSRVGRAAQPKAMRKVSGQLRIKLAQYREMEVFAQFDSDLDLSTQTLLKSGAMLTELMKQDQNTVYALSEEIAILTAYNDGLFDHVAVSDAQAVKRGMLAFLNSTAKAVMDDVDHTGDLNGNDESALKAALHQYFSSAGDAHARDE